MDQLKINQLFLFVQHSPVMDQLKINQLFLVNQHPLVMDQVKINQLLPVDRYSRHHLHNQQLLIQINKHNNMVNQLINNQYDH
jgi:hypothetical protein